MILDGDFVKRKMAVFSKDAVAAALDQLSETLDEAKGGKEHKLIKTLTNLYRLYL